MSAVVRASLGLAGLAMAAYGVWLLLQMSLEQLVSVALWMGGGVVVHDALLAPAVVVLVLVGARFLPPAARVPTALVGLVWGTLTVMAVPVLSGQGGGDENATLLDRPYVLAWSLLTACAVLVVLVWSGVRARSSGTARAYDMP